VATTWVFQRGDRRLFAQRQARRHRVELIVRAADADERVYTFDDDLSFVAFMSEFEVDVVADGWSLADFIVERRQGEDRRARPRGTERRRPAPDSPGVLIAFPHKRA
jgi:hypothetical protein